MSPQPDPEVIQSINRFTERTQKTLTLALREALSLGQNYVGTEHLLLAMLRDPDAFAYRVLDSLVGADTIRERIIPLLVGGQPSEPKLEATEDRSALALAKGMVEIHLKGAPQDASLSANVAEVITALALVAVAEALGSAEPDQGG